MDYLEQKASLLYFNLTKHAYYLGALSWLHVQDRMLALSEMCEPEDPTYIAASRILSLEGYDGENESWRESDRNNEQDSNAGQRRSSGRVYPDDDGFYHFLSRLSKTKDWEFHQADADFFHRSHMGITKEEINQSLMHTSVGFTKIQLRLTV